MRCRVCAIIVAANLIVDSMKTPDSNSQSDELDREFSPVDNELPLRWFRRLHLVPANGIGAGRRAVFFALLTWVPIAAWSFAAGRFVSADSGEPLLHHFGVHVRCLLAIPLFILAEGSLHNAAQRILGQFRSSGVVSPELSDRFEATITGVRRLRDASLPWVFVFGAASAWSVVDQPAVRDDTMSWAIGADGSLGFGGLWFSYVVRPIFLALMLGWVWRILLVAWWFWKVGKLGLALVPTHPDRTGGIAFVEKVPGAFAMVTFAMSAVIASRWAHEIQYHDATLQSFKLPAAAFVILWTLLALLPLLALAPALIAARARAIPAYSALVGEQGRLIHRRWIQRETVADAPLLEAPEIGPVADANAMYDAVKKMRVVPIGKGAVMKVLLPIAFSFVVVAALQIPLKDLMLKLAKALV
jgi:hypothetical protein